MLRDLGAFFLFYIRTNIRTKFVLSKNHCVAILIEYFAKQTMRESAQ